MVINVTSFGRSGLADWVLQRVSAVILGLYALCVVGFIAANPGLGYADLTRYFGSTSITIFSTLTLFSLLAHAWIGMWTVGTDYILPWSVGSGATLWRLCYQGIVTFLLLLYTLWGLSVIWGLK